MTDIASIGSVVRAKVSPRRRDDLKPGVLPYIGKTLRFRSMGMVGPDVCGGVIRAKAEAKFAAWWKQHAGPLHAARSIFVLVNAASGSGGKVRMSLYVPELLDALREFHYNQSFPRILEAEYAEFQAKLDAVVGYIAPPDPSLSESDEEEAR